MNIDNFIDSFLLQNIYLKESALILMCIAFLTILTRTHSDDLIHSRQELVSAMASGVLAGRRRGVGQPQFPSVN